MKATIKKRRTKIDENEKLIQTKNEEHKENQKSEIIEDYQELERKQKNNRRTSIIHCSNKKKLEEKEDIEF